jgi:DNA helicase-2/ATP-dependent DNA helicase PcrA
LTNSELDAGQRAAVLATDGPLIVAAGPGTGKTRVFAHRIAHLIRDRRVRPDEILAVTFTRSAADEMRQRVKALLPGADLRALWVETCHAAALRILREEAYPFAEAAILGEEERAAILGGVVPLGQAAALLDELRAAKQRLEWPQSAPARLYQQRLQSRRLLDFDDLFLFALRLFEEEPEAFKRWRGRFRYVLMDEFQDTSLAQYRFVSRLAGRNFCVIGDPLRLCRSRFRSLRGVQPGPSGLPDPAFDRELPFASRNPRGGQAGHRGQQAQAAQGTARPAGARPAHRDLRAPERPPRGGDDRSPHRGPAGRGQPIHGGHRLGHPDR